MADEQPPPGGNNRKIISFSNILSSLAAAGAAAAFGMAFNLTKLEKDFEALQVVVEAHEAYIKKHEPTIEHRDTRQCGHSSKQDLVLRNHAEFIESLMQYAFEVDLDIPSPPPMDCGPGAGAQ